MRRSKVVFGPFTKRRLSGRNRVFRAEWNGTVLAESGRTVLLEGNRYFPPADVSFDHLEPSDHASVCPWKGTASYYDIVVDGHRNSNAAWYYPNPSAAAAKIEDHVAFGQGVSVSAASPA
ncbi:MAG: DUF427 domain-containing protein [Solirubrobacterales bacterium]|nr:DUF427 domain-containing protein [Solirubrobacterales bacterium]